MYKKLYTVYVAKTDVFYERYVLQMKKEKKMRIRIRKRWKISIVSYDKDVSFAEVRLHSIGM